MKYANDRKVQYVALIGEEEMNEELVLLKNMESGDQVEMSIDEVIHKLITNPAR
jgi:histidyl-tRNA synthetase